MDQCGKLSGEEGVEGGGSGGSFLSESLAVKSF